MATPSSHSGSARFAELDGLRALAVVSVILFHCEITGVFNAGFFGVDMFFTISGFIITAILLKEYRSAGYFEFLNFYFRRLKRLLPPVLGLLLIAFAGTAMLSQEALGKFVADTPAAFLYVSNWWQIVARQDYFDTTPRVLKHLWSLAIEEQFYVVWPPIVYQILKRGGPKAAGVLALAGTAASTAWMAYSYAPVLDAGALNRLYLGTDTHAMGLLAGAALACFWNPWQARIKVRMSQWFWRAAALLALGGLGWMTTQMNTSSPWLYRGAFLLVPALTCVVAYVTMSDRAFVVSTLLRTRVVQWFGLRSYSLYLVHWLVFEWLRLLGYKDFSRWTVLVPALAVVLVVAELMYRCVEVPAIEYDLKKMGNVHKGAVLGGYVIIALGFSAVITWTESTAPVQVAATPMPASSAPPAQPMPVALTPAATPGTPVVPDDGDPADAKVKISGGEAMYALGDSVLLGARDHLARMIPGIQIDAAVGRQASQGLSSVKAWHGKLSSASTVLVHLGTNGYIDEGQFRELLKALADCKLVILINVHADRRWTEPNNELIARMARAFPNTHLVDWHLASASRPDYFVKDGIHLTRRGILAFTSQIKMATGGAPLPDLPPEAPMAGARVHQVAHKADSTAQPAAAAETAAPVHEPQETKETGEPAHDPTPAPTSDAPAGQGATPGA
jgi:peptidoglycan/LPS O-acetylase OafA/YrhL